jgi:anti-sigma factor RsiW
MNPDELNEVLADHLGGELDADGRAAANRAIAADPDLAADVASLQRAVEDLRRLDFVTETDGADARSRPARSRRPVALRVRWRQAAIIVLAFVAGFALRAAMPPPAAPAAGVATDRAEPVAGEADEADWSLRTAAAYMRDPGRSSLTRSLIAVAQPDVRPGDPGVR